MSWYFSLMLIVVERRETFHHYYPMGVHAPGDLTVTMFELKEQAVYTNKYEKIKELALTSEAVCGTVYDIWNIVGAEEVIGCLQYMMNIPEDFDTFWNNEVRY